MPRTDTTTDCPGVPRAVTDDILASRRRCLVVTALATAGGTAVVEDLAAAIRAAEQRAEQVDSDPQTRERVARDLYENHLPTLTAAELVEYDSMLGSVRLTEPALAKLAQEKLIG
jgi:hypothetical protein